MTSDKIVDKINNEISEKELSKQALEQAQAHPLAVPFLFLGRKSVQDNFIWLALVGLIITVVLGFIYPLKHPAPFEKIPASWGWIGFLSYTFLVLCAKPLFNSVSYTHLTLPTILLV